jgi:hypothetical protein
LAQRRSRARGEPEEVISGCGGGGVVDLRSEHGWTLECGAARLVVPWWTGGRGMVEGGREGGDLGFRGNDVGAFYTCDIGRVSGEGALAWAPGWALSC